MPTENSEIERKFRDTASMAMGPEMVWDTILERHIPVDRFGRAIINGKVTKYFPFTGDPRTDMTGVDLIPGSKAKLEELRETLPEKEATVPEPPEDNWGKLKNTLLFGLEQMTRGSAARALLEATTGYPAKRKEMSEKEILAEAMGAAGGITKIGTIPKILTGGLKTTAISPVGRTGLVGVIKGLLKIPTSEFHKLRHIHVAPTDIYQGMPVRGIYSPTSRSMGISLEEATLHGEPIPRTVGEAKATVGHEFSHGRQYYPESYTESSMLSELFQKRNKYGLISYETDPIEVLARRVGAEFSYPGQTKSFDQIFIDELNNLMKAMK